MQLCNTFSASPWKMPCCNNFNRNIVFLLISVCFQLVISVMQHCNINNEISQRKWRGFNVDADGKGVCGRRERRSTRSRHEAEFTTAHMRIKSLLDLRVPVRQLRGRYDIHVVRTLTFLPLSLYAALLQQSPSQQELLRQHDSALLIHRHSESPP